MMAPRILLAAYYFPPIAGGGVNRTLRLIDALREAGVSPSILTVDDAAWQRDPALLDAVSDLRVLRVPNPDWGRVRLRNVGSVASERPPNRGGLLARWLVPDLHVGWSLLAAAVAGALAWRDAFDVVYTTAPPYSSHLIGFAAQRAGKRWVADFRDAWLDAPSRQHFGPRRGALETRLERAVLDRADHVVFATEGLRESALRRAPDLADRSQVAWSGFDAENYRGALERSPDGTRYRLIHAGSVQLDARAGQVLGFLDVLARWRLLVPAVTDTVSVEFVGAEPSLGEAIRAREIDDFVSACAPVPRAELPERLGSAHRCLCLAPLGAAGADTVPGRVFDAVGANRRLLTVADKGRLHDLLARSGIGEAFEPSAPEAMIDSMELERVRVQSGAQLPQLVPETRSAFSSRETLAGLVRVLAHPRPAVGRAPRSAPAGLEASS
jgi:glycosyltransferase involved in cell wall biosynthesis